MHCLGRNYEQGPAVYPLLAGALVAVLGESVEEAVTELVAGVHAIARRRIDLHLAPGQQAVDDLLLRAHLVHEPILRVPIEPENAQFLLRPHACHRRQHTCIPPLLSPYQHTSILHIQAGFYF